MKNLRETITTGALNAAINKATTIVIDVPITYTFSSTAAGVANTQLLYPTEIQIINNSGTEIEWLVISNAAEYAEYVADDTNFQFIRLPDGASLQDDTQNIHRAYKFLIRKNTYGVMGTATAGILVEFISFKPII